MRSMPPADVPPGRLRPVLRMGVVLVSVMISGLTLWAWIAAVPDVVGNPDLPYMRRVLSPILTTFLFLLIGAGGVLLTIGGFRALERRLARGAGQ